MRVYVSWIQPPNMAYFDNIAHPSLSFIEERILMQTLIEVIIFSKFVLHRYLINTNCFNRIWAISTSITMKQCWM